MGVPTPEFARSHRGRVANVIAVALLLGAIFTGVAFQLARKQSDDTNQRLRQEGRDATARIVRLWRTSGKNSTDMVTYVFSAGKARVESDCGVPLDALTQLRVGGDLAVRYIPADPSVNRPVGWEDSRVPLWLATGLPGLCAAISLFLFYVGIRRG